MISEGWLHFVEFELQIVALIIFAGLYTLRISHIVKLPLPKESAPVRGKPAKGVIFSFSTIVNPFSMDSTTKHLWRWIEFIVYHLGALSAILATFTLPFASGMMTYPVRIVFAALCLIFYTDLWRFLYFLVTALFLIYVPFSKISHYVYWFFARAYLGVRFGRRGVLPRKGPQNG